MTGTWTVFAVVLAVATALGGTATAGRAAAHPPMTGPWTAFAVVLAVAPALGGTAAAGRAAAHPPLGAACAAALAPCTAAAWWRHPSCGGAISLQSAASGRRRRCRLRRCWRHLRRRVAR